MKEYLEVNMLRGGIIAGIRKLEEISCFVIIWGMWRGYRKYSCNWKRDEYEMRETFMREIRVLYGMRGGSRKELYEF